jgi:hypothetical protein
MSDPQKVDPSRESSSVMKSVFDPTIDPLTPDPKLLIQQRRRRMRWQVLWLSAMIASLIALLSYALSIIKELKDSQAKVEDSRIEVSTAAGEIRKILAERSTSPAPDIRAFQVPPGTIVAYAGLKVPEGWLPCNGATYSGKEYPSLYDAIGEIWGDGGDGGGPIFRVPDLNRKFLRGAGKDWPVGKSQSWATGMPKNKFKTAERSGEHSHAIGRRVEQDWRNGGMPVIELQAPVDGKPRHGTFNDGSHPHEIVGGDEETRPDNVAVQWIIKA